MIYKIFRDTQLFEGFTNRTFEYNIEDKDINYCIIDIFGRFPKEKIAVNNVCKAMAHILDGEGILWVEGKTQSLKKDDVVVIMPGEKYYWNGKMKIGLSCTPAWYPEQHERVEE